MLVSSAPTVQPTYDWKVRDSAFNSVLETNKKTKTRTVSVNMDSLYGKERNTGSTPSVNYRCWHARGGGGGWGGGKHEVKFVRCTCSAVNIEFVSNARAGCCIIRFLT